VPAVAVTDQAMQQLILNELRALRGAFNDHAANTERRLTSLESQMDRVIDPDPASRSKSRSRRALAQ
jgi:hypothetical protein